MDSKRRRNVYRRVFEKSRWTCQMPVCLAEDRSIDADLAGVDDPWAPTIDHVVRLADGGRDAPDNMRAAHKLCNNHAGSEDESTYKIGDMYPELLTLLREAVRSE